MTFFATSKCQLFSRRLSVKSREGHSMTMILVAIDIGKNVNEIGVFRSDLSAVQSSVTVHHNREGLQQTIATIDRLLAGGFHVKLGNEPTGIYYENWTRALRQHYQDAIREQRLSYELVPPKLVKDAREGLQNSRRRKTDRIDTQAIARCLLLNQGIPIRLPNVTQLAFSQWMLRYRALDHAKRTLQHGLMSQLDQLWPGAFVNVHQFKKTHPKLAPPTPLVQSRPLERKLVQIMLSHFPNPHEALALSESQFHQFLQQHMRAGRKTAQKVLRNLRQNVLPPPDIAEIYAVRVAEDWARLQLMMQQLEQLDLEAAALVDDTLAGVLVSMPGMTPAYATRYLAHIQDPQQFAHADKIWAFAGFDPVLNASGDRHQLGKISRKGDPAFRDTLYQIGQSTARHCPPIRAAFKRKYNPREKNHVLSIIHAAHKANRMLYHLLKTQQTYRDVYAQD